MFTMTSTSASKFVNSAWLTMTVIILVKLGWNKADAQNTDMFSICSIDESYYGILLDGDLQLSAMVDPNVLPAKLRQTHRRVLPYTSSSDEDGWDALIDLDSNRNGTTIRLIYRDVDVPALQYSTVATWNREHVRPKSRGVGTSGLDHTYVHALRPSDWNVNSARNNLFFGDCGDACTSHPAAEEAGNDTARDDTMSMFLPPVDVRGDIARAIGI